MFAENKAFKMQKIAIYVRVSTEELQDYSRQIYDLTQLIVQHGYKEEDIEIFADKMSGFIKNRPELDRMLGLVEANTTRYKVIYVTEITRLGRNPTHTRQLVDYFTELKIPIYIKQYSISTLEPNGTRSMSANIMLQILMEVAANEARTMKERFISGKTHKVIVEGKSKGWNESYGYMPDENKILVINPDEAVIVKQIFELYKQGNGIKSIAATLNTLKIPTRSQTTIPDKYVNYSRTQAAKLGANVIWQDNTIWGILKNTIYKGIRRYKGQTTPIEPIISPELFDECTAIRLNKTHRNYLTSYTYLLKDLIYCGCCGKKYLGNFDPKVGGAKRYRCYDEIRAAKVCPSITININIIESVLYDLLASSTNFLKQLDKPDDILNQIQSDLTMLELTLANEVKSLNEKKLEDDRLFKGYLSGIVTPERYEVAQPVIANELSSIQTKINILNNEISMKKKTIDNYDKEQATAEMIIQAKENRQELKTIFNQFISKLIVNHVHPKLALVTLYVKINGVTMPNPIYLLIQTTGIRQKIKKYKYHSTNYFLNKPVFVNGVLVTNDADFADEVSYITDYKTVEEANVLTMTA